MDEPLDRSGVSPELLVCLVVLVLRESEGNLPPGLLEDLIRQVDRAAEESSQGVSPEPIDILPFAPPDDAKTRAAVLEGTRLAMNLIRRDAADNPRRKAERDALAAGPDGAAKIAALQAAAEANLLKTIRRLFRGNVEALEAEVGEE